MVTVTPSGLPHFAVHGNGRHVDVDEAVADQIRNHGKPATFIKGFVPFDAGQEQNPKFLIPRQINEGIYHHLAESLVAEFIVDNDTADLGAFHATFRKITIVAAKSRK